MVALPPMDAAQRTKQMRTAASGNPGLQEILTRPLLTVQNLHAAWADDDGQLPTNIQAAALADLALLVEGPPSLVQAAALSGGRFLFTTAHEAARALNLVTRAVGLLDRDGTAPSAALLRLGRGRSRTAS